MDWGLLQGLGEGLSQIGDWKMEQDAEKRRNMLAEKLENDRRAYEDGKYDPSQDKPIKLDTGWFKIRYSKNGKEIDRVPLTDLERQTIEDDAEKNRLSIEDLRLKTEDSRQKSELNKGLANYLKNLTPEQREQYYARQAGLAADANTVYITDATTTRAREQNASQEKVAGIRASTRDRDSDDEETLSPMQALYGILDGADSKYMQGENALTPAEVDEAVQSVDTAIKQKFAENRRTGTTPPTRDVIRSLLLKELERRYNAKKGAPSAGSGSVKISLGQQG